MGSRSRLDYSRPIVIVAPQATERNTDTRERIIRTAAELFRRQGYDGTGLNQILDVSGAPRGSLYFHFPGGKRQLAVEAVAASGELLGKGMERSLDSTDDVAEESPASSTTSPPISSAPGSSVAARSARSPSMPPHRQSRSATHAVRSSTAGWRCSSSGSGRWLDTEGGERRGGPDRLIGRGCADAGALETERGTTARRRPPAAGRPGESLVHERQTASRPAFA